MKTVNKTCREQLSYLLYHMKESPPSVDYWTYVQIMLMTHIKSIVKLYGGKNHDFEYFDLYSLMHRVDSLLCSIYLEVHLQVYDKQTIKGDDHKFMEYEEC